MTGLTSCAHCGTAMPLPTGRRARQRYCSELCRKAAWRDRHRDDPAPSDIVSTTVPDLVAVPTAFRDAVANPGGQHRCPHCHMPLAIVSVIVPAAAAHIDTPEVIRINPT
jgi:hypothetical protein